MIDVFDAHEKKLEIGDFVKFKNKSYKITNIQKSLFFNMEDSTFNDQYFAIILENKDLEFPFYSLESLTKIFYDIKFIDKSKKSKTWSKEGF